MIPTFLRTTFSRQLASPISAVVGVLLTTVTSVTMLFPFTAQAAQPYEFVISAPGYSTTHIYRSPFPRSSNIVHLRAERMVDADKTNPAIQSVVTFIRPRGYFDVQRDKLSFDGQTPPPGVPSVGAGVASSKILLTQPQMRSISAEFNGERITGQTWQKAENRVVTLELTN